MWLPLLTIWKQGGNCFCAKLKTGLIYLPSEPQWDFSKTCFRLHVFCFWLPLLTICEQGGSWFCSYWNIYLFLCRTQNWPHSSSLLAAVRTGTQEVNTKTNQNKSKTDQGKSKIKQANHCKGGEFLQTAMKLFLCRTYNWPHSSSLFSCSESWEARGELQNQPK